MTFDSVLFDPTRIWLELDAAVQAEAWQQSQAFATPVSRWTAYLNQLCLAAVMPWLQADHQLQPSPWPNPAALSSLWEAVNGTCFEFDHTRLLLLPSETIDQDELRVPQEWIDSPDWMADYYLMAQVNLDDGWVCLGPFTTHLQLKTMGQYDWRDRTYSLDDNQLTPDISTLWVERSLYPDAVTHAPVAALPTLPLAQAENLLQRLGDPTHLTPRLEIPFEQWAALLAHGGWRQQLAQRRRGRPARQSVVQWLQAGMAELAQQWGWEQVELQPNLAAARGDEAPISTMGLCRQVAIATQPYELRVFPRNRNLSGRNVQVWRFELSSLTPGAMVPAGITLRLLSEDLQPFEGNEDTATEPVEQLFIEVAVEPGEGLVWAIAPAPSGYDQEILRF